MTQNPESNPADDLDGRIARLDRLIEERDDGARGLGVRLALGLARELRQGQAPGTDTSDLVAGWVDRFGAEVVEEAVSQARVLLRDPARMADEFRRRMEPAGPETAKDEPDA